MSLLDRARRRIEQATRDARRVARRLVEDSPLKDYLPSTATRKTVTPANGPVPGRSQQPPRAPLKTEVMHTSDAAVLMGITGIKMALEPHGHPLLVNHWATWCEGCVAELPLLDQLRERWRGRVDFVGVGWEGFSGVLATPNEQLKRVEAVCLEHEVDWATMVFEGKPETLFAALKLSCETVPQTFVLSAGGHPLVHIQGALDSEAINRIEDALRECMGGR